VWAAAWSSVASALVASDALDIAWNFTPVNVLGIVISIYLGFRNSAAYGRWVDARAALGNMVGQSRVLARLLCSAFAPKQPALAEAAAALRAQIAHRHIAWVTVLRHELRGREVPDLAALIGQEEAATAARKDDKLLSLMCRQSANVSEAVARGCVSGLESLQLENCLTALTQTAENCERIRDTPLPRQYRYFSRVYIWVFIAFLPFASVDAFREQAAGALVPFCVVVAAYFATVERTGALFEEPFSGAVTDVPLDWIANAIERSVREAMGEQLPPKLVAHDGYLM
jgi:putative membrane protein